MNNITQKIEELTNAISESKSVQDQIKEVWYEGSREFLNNVFGNLMTPDIKLTGRGDYWRLFSKKGDEWYEFLSINFNQKDWRKGELLDEIRTSVYGTSSADDSELDRLILLGEFGKVLKEEKQDILDGWNEQRNIVSSKLKPIFNECHEIERELDALKSELKEIGFDEAHKRAKTEGITFDKPTTIWLTQDSSVTKVTHFQITGASKSGLTVDLKITYDDYNNEPKTYERKKVRWSNIRPYIK